MTDQIRLEHSVGVHEGYRSTPYKDTLGYWTFANGHCLETNPLTRMDWKELLDGGEIAVSISQAGADRLMRNKLALVEAELARAFAWWPRLNDARQNALIELGYQMGVQKLMLFRRMLAAIDAADWSEAAREGLDSLWAKQTPKRAIALMKQLERGEFL